MNKGQHYKLRSKKWLESQGYSVAFLERMMWIPRQGKLIPIKRDQFGSDLLAMSATSVVFVQVKLGRSNISKAKKEFEKYKFPVFAQRQIHVWNLRGKEPEIINVNDC